jgi:hypothetical protein
VRTRSPAPERNRVESHVPGARGALDERDLVALRADQRGDGVVEIGNATLRFGGRLIAADRGLALEVARHRVEDRARRQGGAGVVEVQDVVHAGRVRSEQRHVERHLLARVASDIHDGFLIVPLRPDLDAVM